MTVDSRFLTEYYLNEFVPSLPSSLQGIALARQTWIPTEADGQITNVVEFDQGHYSLLPQDLQSIFQLPVEISQTIGKAWFLLLGHYVILDHVIDGKLSPSHATTLFLSCLQMEAQTQFRSLLGQSARFWTLYDKNSREAVFAMIQENEYVIRHQAPYSYAAMREIHQEKSGIVRLLVHAMVELSGKFEVEEGLCQILENHAIAMQLLDDTLDWEIDFEQGHYKVPFVMALEQEGLSFQSEGQSISLQTFGDLFIKHGIPIQLCQVAFDLFEEALKEAKRISDDEFSLSKMLKKNLQIASQAKKKWQVWSSVSQFVSKFDS
jgi:hypothetical protein